MTVRSGIIALLSLLLPGCATGQVASQLPKLSILLPANTPSDKFEVRYYLYGSFGANGGYISPEPDSTGAVPLRFRCQWTGRSRVRSNYSLGRRGVSSRPTISACTSRICRSFIPATHCRRSPCTGRSPTSVCFMEFRQRFASTTSQVGRATSLGWLTAWFRRFR